MTGPVTWPCTGPSALNARASAVALTTSAWVIPDALVYTTTAGLRFLETNFSCRFSSCVDSALAGR